MIIRRATPDDAVGMSAVITPIIASWSSDRPTDPEYLTGHYITNPNSVTCQVADQNGVVGFQSVRKSAPGNPYQLPEDWGIIGTYVDLTRSGEGIGKALFAMSLQAAKEAGLIALDATIAKSNARALAYYHSCGFRQYRETTTTISKQFCLE